jgi:hypothetical protein
MEPPKELKDTEQLRTEGSSVYHWPLSHELRVSLGSVLSPVLPSSPWVSAQLVPVGVPCPSISGTRAEIRRLQEGLEVSPVQK